MSASPADLPIIWSVLVDGDPIRAVYELGAADGPVFVFAHGAGGNMNDAAVRAASGALRDRGIGVVRFNFPYAERRQKRPDPMPRLIACIDSVVTLVRDELAPAPLIVGGRSMGGRAASMWTAAGGRCEGLLLLAYPLHPPGKPEQLRVDHLPDITVPVLCVNGTCDAFCTPSLMQETLDGLGANWRMKWLEGADHGFHVLKRSGRTDTGILEEAADEIASWVRTL